MRLNADTATLANSFSRRKLLACLSLIPFAASCGRRATADEPKVIEIVTLPGEIDATPDLRLAAFTSWNDDFSALGVCDLGSRTVDVLHAERRATLRQPTLSADGGLIAFTAKPFAGGPTSLYVAPVKGGPARRVGRRQVFAGPCFSDDGRWILAFAGDLDDGPRELVEIDLESGAEDVVWTGGFASGFRTAYDPMGRGFVVGARGPAASPAIATEARAIDDDTKRGSPRTFRVPRGDGEATLVAPSAVIGAAAEFRGVTSGGDILVRSFSLDDGVRAMLVARHGAARTLWHSADFRTIPDGMAIAADGRRLLTSRMILTQAGDATGRYEIAVRDLGRQTASRLSSSDFRSNLHAIRLD